MIILPRTYATVPAFVDIVVRNYDSPMGVATYKTKQDMPEELQKALPDLDKMKDLFCKSL